MRAALHGQADELRDFKEVATLRTVPVELPPDRPTDHTGGAEAARGLGMNRLAERLEGRPQRSGGIAARGRGALASRL